MVDASLLVHVANKEDDEVTVRFIAKKVKVAPTKAISVPSLELMAAALGLRLARKMSELL